MYQQTYLGGQADLEPLETQYPFRLSLLANLRKDKKIKHRRKIIRKHVVFLLTDITWFKSLTSLSGSTTQFFTEIHSLSQILSRHLCNSRLMARKQVWLHVRGKIIWRKQTHLIYIFRNSCYKQKSNKELQLIEKYLIFSSPISATSEPSELQKYLGFLRNVNCHFDKISTQNPETSGIR